MVSQVAKGQSPLMPEILPVAMKSGREQIGGEQSEREQSGFALRFLIRGCRYWWAMWATPLPCYQQAEELPP
jgi:hypothetical protein